MYTYKFATTKEQPPWKVEMLKAKLPHSEEDLFIDSQVWRNGWKQN